MILDKSLVMFAIRIEATNQINIRLIFKADWCLEELCSLAVRSKGSLRVLKIEATNQIKERLMFFSSLELGVGESGELSFSY